MLIKDHIDSIKHVLNSGIESDDSRMSDRLIYHKMKIYRTLLLQRYVDKHHFLSDFNYQTIACLKLELAFAHDCNCIPDALKCKIRKSVSKIPTIMSRHKTGYLIKSVMYPDGTPIPYRDVGSYKNKRYRKTNDDSKPFWYIYDNYLYVANDLNIAAIIVIAVFEDPELLANLTLCDGNGVNTNQVCFDPVKNDFPIQGELVAPLEELVVQNLLITYQLPEDEVNDANDNVQNYVLPPPWSRGRRGEQI